MDMRNHDLKEDIREYWSKRSQTFDLAFGHRIPPGPELDAWAAAMRDALGARPLKVLETRLRDGGGDQRAPFARPRSDGARFLRGHARRRAAQARWNDRVRFILADAERTMEPDETYDAVVCRHLVWTLTEPEQAFAEWFRLLKPGGRLLVFDGDWSKPTPLGRLASIAVAALEQIIGHDPHYDGAMSERHATIMERLPFGDGLTVERLLPLIEEAGFENIELPSRRPIAAAQRRNADLRNRLRTFFYRRFFLVCSRPSG